MHSGSRRNRCGAAQPPGRPQAAGVPALGGWRAQAALAAKGLRGDHVCAAHGLSVEGAAGGVWERQCHPCPLPAVAGRRVFLAAVAGRFGGIRRDDGDCLVLAEYRRHDGQGAPRPRSRRAEPDGPMGKKGPSGVCSSTVLGSRARLSSAVPIAMTSSGSPATLDATVVPRPKPTARQPQHWCADKPVRAGRLKPACASAVTPRTCVKSVTRPRRGGVANPPAAGSLNAVIPGSIASENYSCAMRKRRPTIGRSPTAPPPSSASAWPERPNVYLRIGS